MEKIVITNENVNIKIQEYNEANNIEMDLNQIIKMVDVIKLDMMEATINQETTGIHIGCKIGNKKTNDKQVVLYTTKKVNKKIKNEIIEYFIARACN